MVVTAPESRPPDHDFFADSPTANFCSTGTSFCTAEKKKEGSILNSISIDIQNNDKLRLKIFIIKSISSLPFSILKVLIYGQAIMCYI